MLWSEGCGLGQQDRQSATPPCSIFFPSLVRKKNLYRDRSAQPRDMAFTPMRLRDAGLATVKDIIHTNHDQRAP